MKSRPPSPPLVLEADVVDVHAGTLRRSLAIVIEDERITGVFPAATIGSAFDSFERVVVDRGVVMPGLIDGHVHACGWPFGSNASRSEGGATARFMAHAVRNLTVSAHAGITSVRDLGGGTVAPYAIKAAWRDGVLDGSRPLVSGPMITAIGGHGMERRVPFGLEVSGASEARRAVRAAIAAGADVIKLVTSGLVTRTELTLAELSAAVTEAHWCGVSVAIHANFSVRGIENSVEVGCDSVEHGCVATPATLDRMATQGTALCPTLAVMDRIARSPDDYGGDASALVSAVSRTWESHCDGVGYAHDAGVPIIAGTDAGMPGVEFDALFDELMLLEKCGLSVADVLRAATSNVARVLRRDDLGTIAAGASADLVVLDANPLDALRNVRAVRRVMIRGRWASSACSSAASPVTLHDPSETGDTYGER